MTIQDLTKIYYALINSFKPKTAIKLFEKLIKFTIVKK